MEGRENLKGNSGDRVIRIVGGYISSSRCSANFGTSWIGYFCLKQWFLTVRQTVYRKWTYRVANRSVQVTDVVNVGGIVEISEQPIEWTVNQKTCSLMIILILGDMHYSLPILLDEYHNILDVTEGALSSGNYDSANKDKKLDVTKRRHLEEWNYFEEHRYIYIY